MSALLAAVEAGSLSKASRKLGIPLATLSRKVGELESYLNATLLVRSAKGLELTAAGRSYVAAITAVLEQLGEAERAAAGEYTKPKGNLVVTGPIMFGRLHVLPVVTRFLSAYPDVAVDLVLTDRPASFPDDQIDVALRIGALADSDLIACRIGTVRRVLCASPNYLAELGTPATPADLVRHKVISFESVSSETAWIFEADGVEVAGAFRARLSFSTINAAIEAGLHDAGLVRAMSYQVVELVQRGRLRVVLDAFEPRPLPVHLVYHGQRRLPLKLRAFIDFVTPRLRNRLADAAL